MTAFELDILIWIRETIVCDWLTPIFRAITYFGEFGIGWIAIAVLLICIKKTRKIGWTVGVALLVGVLLGECGLKFLIQRPRPFFELADLQLLIPEPFGYSCPSGHTTASFAAATSIFFYHKKWGSAALVLAVLVGFSRMYFTVHYPTDVLFGVALGVFCAIAAWWTVKKIKEVKNG